MVLRRLHFFPNKLSLPCIHTSLQSCLEACVADNLTPGGEMPVAETLLRLTV